MAAADNQTLRVLAGRYVLERLDPHGDNPERGEVLAVVHGPDGGACMRRDDSADDAWVPFWNGDAAHPPDATGMCAAIIAPLAAGGVPVGSPPATTATSCWSSPTGRTRRRSCCDGPATPWSGELRH